MRQKSQAPLNGSQFCAHSKAWLGHAGWVLAAAALLGILPLGVKGDGQTNVVKPVLSASVEESYNSNVMLQNFGAEANQESFVTTVLPVVGARASGSGNVPYSVSLIYAPDFSFFKNLSRENYLRQIGMFDFNVKYKDFSSKAGVKFQYTDGGTAPPVWGTVAEGAQVPALGVPEIRNRRKNTYTCAHFMARQEIGKTFVRGVFDARIWDFMTEDTIVQGLVIQNYYDRSDINGGVDFGMKVHPRVEPFIGYRLGHQDQEFRVSSPSYSYANNYQRVIFGLACKPIDTITLSGEAGPSFYSFDPSTIPVGTDTEQTYVYFVAGAAWQITSNTTFRIAGGDHLLPCSSGNGVFQNLTASGTLDHRFSSKFRGSVRFAFTQYNFFADFLRDDQSFEPKVNLQYSFNNHFSAAVWYSYLWGQNILDIPNGSNRNYGRQLVGIGFTASY